MMMVEEGRVFEFPGPMEHCVLEGPPHAALKVTTEYVIKAFDISDRLTVKHGSSDHGVKIMDNLQHSTDLVRENNMQTPDLKNWLSAVISHTNKLAWKALTLAKTVRKKIKEIFYATSLDQVEKITGITLDIVSSLTKILEQFNLKLDLKPASRRLIGVEVDNQGYPSWFSATG